jgi:hypothetical protein
VAAPILKGAGGGERKEGGSNAGRHTVGEQGGHTAGFGRGDRHRHDARAEEAGGSQRCAAA